MRKSVLLVFIFSLVSVQFIYGQLPSKVAKLEGKWEYREGSGFEIWKLVEGSLEGTAYRINKVGDTSQVEELSIGKVNKTLVHQLTTFNFTGDTTIVTTYRFIGEKNKMRFVNIDSNTPYSIEFKFAFLNRNKLFIRLKYGINSKQTELVMYRTKD